jgi:flagellar biosynthetic protein FliP
MSRYWQGGMRTIVHLCMLMALVLQLSPCNAEEEGHAIDAGEPASAVAVAPTVTPTHVVTPTVAPTFAPTVATALATTIPPIARTPQGAETALPVRIVLGLTLLAVVPAILMSTTAFLRIIIVLSMLRHAIGMPETPPNPVLIGLALFLTLFTMQPVLERVNHDAFEPFMNNRISMEQAGRTATAPLREFMVRQTREQDLALMVELSKRAQPRTIDDISLVQLVPAFMLSELRAAFQIGFVIFLPFLLIDLIVSSILMSLGMMMMPPITIALPLKVLMFVLVDGWALILKSLVGSFH